MSEFITQQNKIITSHRLTLSSKLKSAANRSSRLYKLKTSEKKDRNTSKTIAIGITFEKHGIYVEKGVGRGRGIDSGKTKPMPWFNPVVELYVPVIAEDLAINAADLLQKALIL